MNLKHTPGPWVTGKVTMFDGYYGVWGEARKICELNPNFEPEANAKLIACAPEMLEALINNVKKISNYYKCTPNQLLDRINMDSIKIIEKATGQKIEDLL